MKQDVYERVTAQIVAELEKGERPWFKPWNAEHAAGRIKRAIFSAAAHAQRAADYLTGLQPQDQKEQQTEQQAA